MQCVNSTGEGYLVLSNDNTCSFILMTQSEFTDLSAFAAFFKFDAADVGIAFGAGIFIWALGLKMGAIWRLIISARRG